MSDILVQVALPNAAADYISSYGTSTTLFLEYGTATTPANGTATAPLVSGTEFYDFWVAGASNYYYRWRISDSSGTATFTEYSPVFQVPVAYATLEEVLRGIDLPDESRYPELEGLLVEATDYITTRICGGRRFFRDPVGTGTKTLTLDVDYPYQRRLSLARGRGLDIVSLTTVEVAGYTGDAYTTLTSGSTGYYLVPDYPLAGHSYTDLVLSDQGTVHTTFPKGHGTVRLTGVFGWSAVPDMVRRATVDLVRALWNNRGREGEPVGMSQFGAPVFAGMPRTVRDLANSEYAWRKWTG